MAETPSEFTSGGVPIIHHFNLFLLNQAASITDYLGLGGVLRRLRQQLRQAKAREIGRLLLTDAVAAAPCPPMDQSAHPLTAMIARTTMLQSWWLNVHEGAINDKQMHGAPFTLDPDLVTQALRTRQTVRRQPVIQPAQAFAYMPKVENGRIQGLLALSSASDIDPDDLNLDEKWAEFLCACWRCT